MRFPEKRQLPAELPVELLPGEAAFQAFQQRGLLLRHLEAPHQIAGGEFSAPPGNLQIPDRRQPQERQRLRPFREKAFLHPAENPFQLRRVAERRLAPQMKAVRIRLIRHARRHQPDAPAAQIHQKAGETAAGGVLLTLLRLRLPRPAAGRIAVQRLRVVQHEAPVHRLLRRKLPEKAAQLPALRHRKTAAGLAVFASLPGEAAAPFRVAQRPPRGDRRPDLVQFVKIPVELLQIRVVEGIGRPVERRRPRPVAELFAKERQHAAPQLPVLRRVPEILPQRRRVEAAEAALPGAPHSQFIRDRDIERAVEIERLKHRPVRPAPPLPPRLEARIAAAGAPATHRERVGLLQCRREIPQLRQFGGEPLQNRPEIITAAARRDRLQELHGTLRAQGRFAQRGLRGAVEPLPESVVPHIAFQEPLVIGEIQSGSPSAVRRSP